MEDPVTHRILSELAYGAGGYNAGHNSMGRLLHEKFTVKEAIKKLVKENFDR